MKDLTASDLERAALLGMDASEAEHSSDARPKPLARSELWRLVMADAPQSEYAADAISRLREAYERGRSDFW